MRRQLLRESRTGAQRRRARRRERRHQKACKGLPHPGPKNRRFGNSAERSGVINRNPQGSRNPA